jgi:hypothetical protein
MYRFPLAASLALLAACGGAREGSSTTCGLAAVIGPQSLLSQFGVERQTLSLAPDSVPGRLVARVAGGPAFGAIVGRSSEADSLLLVGVEGRPPGEFALGFGVLATAPGGLARGLVLYEGLPVEGAPTIGTVTFGASTAPLIGVEADPGAYEDANCPTFPDSLLR